ncbi:MAG TPA: hypothetical protein VN623_03090 [Hyphomicrobium sp.]|uniref:hypothetical protein n=1 Tax=Hyphomicrobium sp. TaxID=82 RepID=UPI002BCD8A44|nr:hypothetical protein [Hyphomicrobium sp.]HXE00916.1 hypothetical protein [Hyphomicrobium sp.]
MKNRDGILKSRRSHQLRRSFCDYNVWEHMMAGPTISTRRSGAVRLVHLSIGISMLAGGLAGYSDQGWAKHHKSKSQADSPTPADPCAALNAFIQKHVTEMKKLKAEIEAEKTAVPNSLEAAFERLQGKAFVDVEKNDKLAETRKEANAVNSLLRAQGCTPVDIDRALANP